MRPFWEIVASNALLVVVLAVGVALLGRVWKNPWYLYLLWVLVLLKLVTPPMVTISIVSSARPPPPASEARRADLQLTHQPRVEASRQETASITIAREPRPSPEDRAGSNAPTSTLGGAPSVAAYQGILWLTVFGWVWAAGVMLFASGHACRILRFKRLFRSSESPSSAVSSMAEGIAKRLGLRSVPRIRMLPVRVSPLVWSLGGWPQVFLPTALFERLDGPAQEAILAHELAHVWRKDHWVRLLEMAITTLFWWHPVVWWAARQLRELEDQCCDGVVVDIAPSGAKRYAIALLDTLDFLSERSVAAPLGATAARSSASMTRRIAMLKEHSWSTRLTLGRLLLLLTVSALPMTLAFGEKPPEATDKRPQDAVEWRAINRLVKDFPEKTDLSTPESAFAAYERAWARRDAKAVLELGWYAFTDRDVRGIQRFMDGDAGKDPAAYRDALLHTEVVEVAIYRDAMAEVISKLNNSPQIAGSLPYSGRSFGKIDGVWKNLGEDRLPSLEAARETFDRKKENLWQSYVNVREGIKSGKPISVRGGRPKRSAPIAPGESLGISVEKADLMGRVEWVLMHGGRDITARKTIEWSAVEKDADGNRKIRYKFYATTWDKDVYIVNETFTFDAKGNLLDVEEVEGFPKKHVEKPVDVNSQEGMKELVEDFFRNNFRDITSRETIEWSEVTKAENGNSSIRYKYRAKIWGKDTMIMNQVFTFDPKGKFVSVKQVDGFPQKQ